MAIMNILNYKILIANLPVRQQCFTTKRTTWNKAEYEISWLKIINDKLFSDKTTLTISRQDIFETEDPIEKIIKVIYWGYTAGMRGNHFVNILKNIDTIKNSILKFKANSRLTDTDFLDLTKTFKNVEGLGLSTYSKLLYFFKISFNGNPCLILDQRLIDVFANKTYSEYIQIGAIRYGNAEKKYLNFFTFAKNQLKARFEGSAAFCS
jgi:hypothetical protein